MKIADFGLSTKLTGGNHNFHLDEKCGTLLYQSPEQAKPDNYGKPADVWAVGFIMYELLSLKHPLWNMETDNRDTYREKIKKPQTYTYFPNFSDLAKSFFRNMCHYRPSNRYTVETALCHPWITRKKKERIPMNPLDDKIYLYEMEKKLKYLFSTIHFMSVIKLDRTSPEEELDRNLKLKLRKT